ncbi:MAG: energy transducer TonB [Candidatus Omnitrophica bacterium]|nr:energy transducer TonB [Candidatus Omnitrophota bacterium]
MRKTILFTLFFTAVFLPFTPLRAEESSSSPALSLSAVQGEPASISLPFEFFLGKDEWAQGKASKVFTTGFQAPGFVLPSLKEDPAPIRYPRWAVQEGWEGTFIIAVEILTTGEVDRFKVMQSTGYSLLDEAATDAVRKWHFHPAQENGKSIVTCIQIPIHFRLED